MKYSLPMNLALPAVALLALLSPASTVSSPVLAQAPAAPPQELRNDAPIAEVAANGPPGIVPLPETDLAAQPLPRPNAETLLEQARTMLARRRSIVAKLRYQAQLFERAVVGSGDYVQGPASSRLMRYEVRMQIGDREIHQLQVNDGRYLWQQRQYKDTPELERIDVEKVLAAEQGSGAAPAGNALAVLGLGGLGRMLTTLHNDFVFQKVFRAQLDGVNVYGIEGTWRPEVLKTLGVDSAAKLRAHVPDRVVIYFGCDDFFPYRFEYLRTPSGAGQGTDATPQTLLVIELFEVQFDVLLDDALFRFNAGSRSFVDVTDRALSARTARP